MQVIGSEKQPEADLHWLAFLLTGRRGLSLDTAAEDVPPPDGARLTFSTWMMTWSRRVVISKALAAIRHELTASARRTKSKRLRRPALPGRDWELDRNTTRVELEKSLLAIDVFPRAALLLSIFERSRGEQPAGRANSSGRRGNGLMERTNRLARMQG